MVNFYVISKSQKCFTVYRDTVSVHMTDSVHTVSVHVTDSVHTVSVHVTDSVHTVEKNIVTRVCVLCK